MKKKNRLTISEEQFITLYPDLKNHYDFFNDEPEAFTDKEFEERYLTNKLWRLNNLYSIVNKEGDLIPYKMNLAQHIVHARSRQHPRQIILKSRQRGISTHWLITFEDDAIFCPHLNIGLMAQGKSEASTLLERAKLLWNTLDENVKKFSGVTLVKDNNSEITFSNKSTIFIRVSFRSATLQRLHISEMGKIANEFPKRAHEVKTGSLQALYVGNTGIIESTAEGHNDFKDMWDKAVDTLENGIMTAKDFYPTFISWLDDPDCNLEQNQKITSEHEAYFKGIERETGLTMTRNQKNFWIAQERELGGSIYQEYPATPVEAFKASRDGTYFAKMFNEHVRLKDKIVKNLYNPTLPTDIYIDIGVDDYFVLVSTQWYEGEWRIIDEHWSQGKSLQHYLRFIKNLPYPVRAVRCPHDIKVRDVSSDSLTGNAVSRYDIANEFVRNNKLNWRIDVLPKDSIAHGIEAVRRIIPKMKIDKRCSYIIDCFDNYSKQWDEKLQIWKEQPLRNKYTHGADCIRQLAVNTIELHSHHQSIHKRKKQYVNTSFAI